MAKKSVIYRNYKRKLLINKFFKLRKIIKNNINNNFISKSEKWKYILEFQKFPRDSSLSRFRNRCNITGRSRGYIREFGLSRLEFRRLAIKGLIPGLKKSSW